MVWLPLEPRRQGAGSLVKSGVSVSGAAGAGHRNPMMTVTIRPQVFGGPAWIKPGARCDVLVGGGEHHGMLRITPAASGAHEFRAIATAKDGTSCLRLPWLKGAPPAKQPSRSCEFDFQDGWLELTLPAWAIPPATAAAAAPAVQAATVAAANEARQRAGYVPVSDRLPDPAARDRADARARGQEIRG